MKIEVNGKNGYKIFINREYIKEVNFEEKDSISEFVKKYLIKIKDKLKLRGFYKVKVFPHKKLGLYLDIKQLEELEFSNNIDLRIIISLDEKFFFETDDYFLVSKYSNVRYLDGKFYCLIDDYFDEILEIVEFGDIIYGEEVINLLNKSIILI